MKRLIAIVAASAATLALLSGAKCESSKTPPPPVGHRDNQPAPNPDPAPSRKEGRKSVHFELDWDISGSSKISVHYADGSRAENFSRGTDGMGQRTGHIQFSGGGYPGQIVYLSGIGTSPNGRTNLVITVKQPDGSILCTDNNSVNNGRGGASCQGVIK